MSLYHALDTACEQAQRYADELHRERMLHLAARARIEVLDKRLRDVEVLLHSKMPMTALDYLKGTRDDYAAERHPQRPH